MKKQKIIAGTIASVGLTLFLKYGVFTLILCGWGTAIAIGLMVLGLIII